MSAHGKLLLALFVLLLIPLISRAADPVAEKDVMVPMRDGIKLATDIVRPGGDGKYPVILSRTPYKKNGAQLGWIAKMGYAYVDQDVRGRYGSGGEFSAFQNEGDDGFDTIEWIAKQPWCDGNVGMAGGSYLGLTQVAAAAARPPHLRCILPGVPPADFDHYSGFDGGAIRYELVNGWLVGMAFSSQRVLNHETPKEELSRWQKDKDFKTWCWHLPVADPGPLAVGGPSYVASWTRLVEAWEKPGAWKGSSA
ncbi:MAG TPA: CocE/NonD family hydrolase, partial [Tepidisphaeraceae bacterium]|nr:CocE/NonD family hydrolase [Tepidisphaeraceae bacterium]